MEKHLKLRSLPQCAKLRAAPLRIRGSRALRMWPTEQWRLDWLHVETLVNCKVRNTFFPLEWGGHWAEDCTCSRLKLGCSEGQSSKLRVTESEV